MARGSHGKKKHDKAVADLAAAGVYRIARKITPSKVWWLASTGKGSAKLRFNRWEEDHSFTVEEDGAGQETTAEREIGAMAGDNGGGASGVRGLDVDCAAGTAGEGSGDGTDEEAEIIRQRCASSLTYTVYFGHNCVRLMVLFAVFGTGRLVLFHSSTCCMRVSYFYVVLWCSCFICVSGWTEVAGATTNGSTRWFGMFVSIAARCIRMPDAVVAAVQAFCLCGEGAGLG